jgi:hypothetical protein
MLPCSVEMLHEQGIALLGRRLTHLHNSHVAASPNDVAQVEEVIS